MNEPDSIAAVLSALASYTFQERKNILDYAFNWATEEQRKIDQKAHDDRVATEKDKADPKPETPA